MEVRNITITIRLNKTELKALQELKATHNIYSNGHMVRVLMQWYKISQRLRKNDTNIKSTKS